MPVCPPSPASGDRRGPLDSWIFYILGALALEKVIRSLPVPFHQGMELLGKKMILAYADDMVIGCSREEIITKPANLIAAVKPMGLEINQDNTKYMVIDRRTGNTQNLIVSHFTLLKFKIN